MIHNLYILSTFAEVLPRVLVRGFRERLYIVVRGTIVKKIYQNLFPKKENIPPTCIEKLKEIFQKKEKFFEKEEQTTKWANPLLYQQLKELLYPCMAYQYLFIDFTEKEKEKKNIFSSFYHRKEFMTDFKSSHKLQDWNLVIKKAISPQAYPLNYT